MPFGENVYCDAAAVRFFHLIFKATGCTNYSKKEFVLLWSRIVNVHGRSEKNTSPCD